jgi:hypothetical protein
VVGLYTIVSGRDACGRPQARQLASAELELSFGIRIAQSNIVGKAGQHFGWSNWTAHGNRPLIGQRAVLNPRKRQITQLTQAMAGSLCNIGKPSGLGWAYSDHVGTWCRRSRSFQQIA